MKTARIIKKICPLETLLSFSVGDHMIFKFHEIKYTTLYPTIKRLEKKSGMRFFVTTNGYPDGTYVRRDA